jgi:hypothetical protein
MWTVRTGAGGWSPSGRTDVLSRKVNGALVYKISRRTTYKFCLGFILIKVELTFLLIEYERSLTRLSLGVTKVPWKKRLPLRACLVRRY